MAMLAETNRLEEQVFEGRKNLVRIRNALQSRAEEQARTEGEARQIEEMLRIMRAELAEYEDDTVAKQDSIEDLRADIKRLEEAKQRLSARAADPSPDTGQRIRSYVGDGNRQYLTGMQMGGRRVLILVDASTSMLGRTYVNVIRFRNMGDAQKRRSPKWQQAVNTVDWLTTQITPGARFQIYAFNEEAASVIPGTDGQWLEATDGSALGQAVDALRALAPAKGTSLYKAFQAVRALDPPPDNIYLLTDGLPTQGRSAPSGSESVKPERRIDYFNQAVKELPGRVPVNVLLFPMDGDPAAAGLFWQLAATTRGSFLTPAEDWP
jgi:hypothetical protein